jgi:hypothetical protein
MIGAWRRLVFVATAAGDPLPLALFRIALGLGALFTVGSVAWSGLVPSLWVDASAGGYRPLGPQHWLVEALGGSNPGVVWALVAVSLASSAALMVGLGGRLAAGVALVAAQALTDANGHAGGSYDQLLTNGLWLCVIAPTTATWSIDAWIRRGSPLAGRPVPAWARLLPAYQIILVYWSTGVQKVSAHWTPGGDFSALYYILQQPTWQHRPMEWVAWIYPLTQVATAATWSWEVSAPLWLLALYYQATRARRGWVRAWFNAWDVRALYAAVGLTFHALLLATMNVGPFPIISLAFYACLWRGEEYRSVVRMAATRGSGADGGSPPAAPTRPPGPPR